MASSDYIPFAVGGSANVLSQAAYAALTSITQNGFSAGIAPSIQLNKVWRQSSIMSAVLAQFIVDRSGQNAVDDGTITTLLANLKASAAALNGDATQVFSVAPATQPAHALQLQQAQGMVGTYNGFTSYAVNTILSRSDVGQLVGASSVTLTLPLAATWAPTAERGDGFTIASTASVGNSTTVTVNTTGGTDHINLGATSVTTLVIPSGQAIRITRVSSVTWLAEGIAVGANIPLVVAPAVAANQAMQLGQVSGVVGQTRNLVMNVATASATATLTADEIIVETALGGLRYCLSSVGLACNLATQMDTGAAPAAGYAALYVIFNPNAALSGTNPRALFTNATAAVQPEVYGGAHPVAGYTASALLTVIPTTAASLIAVCAVQDRHVSTASVNFLTSTIGSSTPGAVNVASVVPFNAKTIDISNQLAIPSGTGVQLFVDNLAGVGTSVVNGINAPTTTNNISGTARITTPQTVYRITTATSGSVSLSLSSSGYTI